MRKRTSTPSKAANASRPSASGPKTFRKSNDGTGRSFKKERPEVESRFSKPSIKKSSFRVASGNGDNAGQKARPNFDHEKGNNERSGFGKPGFDKPGFDKPRFDKPRFDKPSFKPSFDKPGSDRPRFPKKEGGFRSPDDKKDFGQRERPSGDREFKPRSDRPTREGDRPRFERRDNDRPAQARESRPFRSRDESSPRERPSGDREFKPRPSNRDDRGGKPAFKKKMTRRN